MSTTILTKEREVFWKLRGVLEICKGNSELHKIFEELLKNP